MMNSEMLNKSIVYAERNLLDDDAPHLKVDKAFIRQHWDLNSKLVLDFGCGMGGMSLWYAKNWNCRVHAVDVDSHHLQIAQELKKRHQADRVEFEKRDILEQPLTQLYDAIFMNDVAEHIAYPVLEKILEQFAHIMAPDATLFISYPPWEGPYASHVQNVTGVLWSQFIPKPLLMAWIKRKNKVITGAIESDFIAVYNGLNHLNHKRLIELTNRAGFTVRTRVSHSILKKARWLKDIQPEGFPFKYLVSKELLVFQKTEANPISS